MIWYFYAHAIYDVYGTVVFGDDGTWREDTSLAPIAASSPNDIYLLMLYLMLSDHTITGC